MEPRARAARHKGQLNFGRELGDLLAGYGAPGDPLSSSQSQPYPETLRVLDEMVTDFIIETCHSAVEVANYSGRQKLKTSDFEFVLRKDPMKVGHVQTMFERSKEIKDARKGADLEGLGGGGAARIGVEDLTVLAREAGEEGTRKGVGRGKGRKKKREREGEGEEGAGGGGGAEDARSNGAREEDGGGGSVKAAGKRPRKAVG